MEVIEKDAGQEFWKRLTLNLTSGEISEAVAKSVVSSLVMREMEANDLSKQALATKLWLSKRELNKLLDGDLNVSFELLRKICDVFGYAFTIGFVKVGASNE